jgi:hypothetical protein
MRHIVQQPLSSTFMLGSMLGFFCSLFIVMPISRTWGFTFAFMFTLFFIAAVLNFTHAPDEDVLAVHEPHRHLKHLHAFKKR